MTRALHRTTNWFVGGAVWLCAALVFPLHLGHAGAPAAALLIYAPVAAGLLLIADILHDPRTYRGGGSVRSQALPFLLAVAVPAAFAFVVGQALAPLEESMETDVCQLGGYSAAPDGSIEELNDGFDMTADCAPYNEG